MTAVSGVRSSWEMFERNSSLMRRASNSATYCRSSSEFDSTSAALARRNSSMRRAFSAVAAIWSATMRSRLRVSVVMACESAK